MENIITLSLPCLDSPVTINSKPIEDPIIKVLRKHFPTISYNDAKTITQQTIEECFQIAILKAHIRVSDSNYDKLSDWLFVET
jgi:hypothetical protein